MKKTPTKELLECLLEYWEFYGDESKWLKKEKEFAHKCFIAGADYGIDHVNAIEWGEECGVQPDFNTWYKQFEDANE